MELDAQHANMDAQGASQDRAIELASNSSSSSDAEPVETVQSPSPSLSSHDIRNGVLSAESLLQLGEALQPESVRKRGIAVVVHPVERAWEYRLYGGPVVSEIVERYDDGGFIEYLVRYDDESEEVVSCGLFASSILIIAFKIFRANTSNICQTSTQPYLRVSRDTAYRFKLHCLCSHSKWHWLAFTFHSLSGF